MAIDLLSEATKAAGARAARFDAPAQDRKGGGWSARISASDLEIEGKGETAEAALEALLAKAPIPDAVKAFEPVPAAPIAASDPRDSADHVFLIRDLTGLRIVRVEGPTTKHDRSDRCRCGPTYEVVLVEDGANVSDPRDRSPVPTGTRRGVWCHRLTEFDE